MTVKAVGIIVDDPGKLWFRYADVSVVKREGRQVIVLLHHQQSVTINTTSEAAADKMMRDIVRALEETGQP